MNVIDANGAKIPAIGLGTWELRGRTCARLVEQALRLGYRHIDTAQVYENEREVGEGLRASGIKRDEVFVTTKVWTTHFAPHDLERSTKESLSKLHLSEVDLLLLHWPNPRVPAGDPGRAGACQANRSDPAHRRFEFYRGLDRGGSRGLSGAPGVRSGRVPSLSRPDQGPGSLRADGMAVVAYSPVAKGRIKNDATLARIGQAYGKTAAQVCLRWLVQQNVAAIPRTSRIERLSENIDIFDFALSDQEMARLSAMGNAKGRLTNFGFAPKWD
jgi:diketogulonate reductase-like aldo/keto reductase